MGICTKENTPIMGIAINVVGMGMKIIMVWNWGGVLNMKGWNKVEINILRDHV
jgi:ABC-type uncharacterized transport system permease subunit